MLRAERSSDDHGTGYSPYYAKPGAMTSLGKRPSRKSIVLDRQSLDGDDWNDVHP